MATAFTPHTALSLFLNDHMAVLQPKDASSQHVETLSIDLRSGTVQVLQSAPMHGQSTGVLGVLGVCRLHKGVCLVVIREAKQVARLAGHDIFEAVKCQLVYDRSGLVPENKKLLALLQDAVSSEQVGTHYFSYSCDVTITQQRAADVVQADPSALSLPSHARADPRFWWNRALCKPLVEAGAHRFVLPAILGFVRQLEHLSFSGKAGRHVSANLTLIARRSGLRAGCRHWRRGTDTEGHAANFVETEQVLEMAEGGGAQRLASYVQVRGSIPLLWTQLPNIKYKPTTLIAPSSDSASVLTRHFQALLQKYTAVVAINLVNQCGTEGKLEAMFGQESAEFSRQHGPGLRYFAYDFHHECRKGKYENLKLLVQQLQPDIDRFVYFERGPDGAVVRRQGGVMRTNCIDCLDRTNVVQGVLARKALEDVLSHAGLLPPGAGLPEAYPQVEKKFKVLWADHGDAVSTQYAGTGAMKSGFTRTGKRTFAGVIDDGIKALVRFYLNNFQDGRKQDAIDLITGNYVPDGVTKPPLRRQPSPFVPIAAAALAITMGFYQLGSIIGNADQIAAATAEAAAAGVTAGAAGAPPTMSHLLLTRVVAPLLAGTTILLLVIQNGKFLVDRPQLCPQLAATVRKPPRKAKTT